VTEADKPQTAAAAERGENPQPLSAPDPARPSAPRFRLKVDPFIVAILAAVLVASVLPARGEAAFALGWAVKLAIGLLFFLHGARLSREAVAAGVGHWRLHLTVFSSTFVLFPLLGLVAAWLLHALVPSAPKGLEIGLVFLGCLPSTVQSSIAFTSIARGNVPAAVTSASFSNLVGIFVTPLLAGVLLSARGHAVGWREVEGILLQLLAPFVAGQLLRPMIGAWARRNAKLLGLVDRGSIVMIVYAAFSEAVVRGIWSEVTAVQLAVVLAISVLVLAVVIGATTFGSRALGFARPDQIAIVFCGSKKSLATGVPMAGILFPAASVGLVVLPLMIFHQVQLMVCAVLAQRYAAQSNTVP
jgi:sodium/bile acid cotransporter 7